MGSWLIPAMDGFDREVVGYMSQCLWSEDYETNYNECVKRFGEANVITILKAKSLYHTPVIEDFKEIFDRIIKLFDFYVDLPENYKKIIALWIIGTYVQKEFESYPFLFLNARKGSGKTRTERLISHLAYKGYGEVNTGISESALFRCEEGATLILDEFESITNKDKQTLREYLQASYKKGATVTRMKKVRKDGKEEYEAQKFHPYRPIVMANINGMDDVLGDRCLTLILEHSENPKITKIIEDFENNNEIKELLLLLNSKQCSLCSVVTSKKHIQGWNNYINNLYTLNYTYTHTTPNYTQLHQKFYDKINEMDVNGRNLELVFPLLSLINIILPERLEEFISIFKEIINIKIEEDVVESKDTALIEYVSQLNTWAEYIETRLILQGFKEYIGWTTEDDWLNSKWIGRALTRLQLYSSKRRMAKGTEYLLNVHKAKEMSKLKESKSNTLQGSGGSPSS